VIPEFEVVIGFRVDSARQPLPLEEHLFAVVQATADAGAPLVVRLAALLHDLAKPETDATESEHAAAGAATAARILRRLRYPNVVRDAVTKLVAAHGFRLDVEVDAVFARRFLASHGLEAARDLVELKRADLAVKAVPDTERERLEELARELERQRESVYRLTDLALNGDDLVEIGYREGPELGAALARLLDDVIDEPALNRRETLLVRAAELAR
jgi:tRNA nucleotidyltransferase (CCA-adding enzyme)